MTSCITGPNGGRCHVCVVWDAQAERIHQLELELSEALYAASFWHQSAKFWKERPLKTLRFRDAIDALRNVLGRTIETRVDPKTGKPYQYLGEERRRALELAGEVMKGAG